MIRIHKSCGARKGFEEGGCKRGQGEIKNRGCVASSLGRVLVEKVKGLTRLTTNALLELSKVGRP